MQHRWHSGPRLSSINLRQIIPTGTDESDVAEGTPAGFRASTESEETQAGADVAPCCLQLLQDAALLGNNLY